MTHITTARNPKVNQVGTVDLEIDHPAFGWLTFSASPDDVEPHGRDLYARAMAGEFGPVAPWVEPDQAAEGATL